MKKIYFYAIALALYANILKAQSTTSLSYHFSACTIGNAKQDIIPSPFFNTGVTYERELKNSWGVGAAYTWWNGNWNIYKSNVLYSVPYQSPPYDYKEHIGYKTNSYGLFFIDAYAFRKFQFTKRFDVKLALGVSYGNGSNARSVGIEYYTNGERWIKTQSFKEQEIGIITGLNGNYSLPWLNDTFFVGTHIFYRHYANDFLSQLEFGVRIGANLK